MTYAANILMSTFNGSHTLPRVLEGYCRQPELVKSCHIIIVDNGSDDNTSNILQRYKRELPMTILFEERRGKAIALNRALTHLDAHLVIFTDDDAVPHTNWYRELFEAVERAPDAAVFGGAIEPLWEATRPNWLDAVPLGVTYGLTDTELQEGPIDPGLIWGANMAIRREVIDAGYLFDETRGPSLGRYIMGVETEFTERLAAHGCNCWFAPAAKVQHIIRPEQLKTEWVINRAFKFGRDIYLKRKDNFRRYPCVLGIPRWMLRKYMNEHVRAQKAHKHHDARTEMNARWELRYLEGIFYQIWQEVSPWSK